MFLLFKTLYNHVKLKKNESVLENIESRKGDLKPFNYLGLAF